MPALADDGTMLVVGANGEASDATGVGGDETINSAFYTAAAYLFKRVGSVWSQDTYVKASNTELGDRFGTSVAIAGDGSRFAVGAPEESSWSQTINGDQANNEARGAGAVYVFRDSGTGWLQEA